MKHSVAIRHVLLATALSAGAGVACAQGNAALDGIAKYREMLQDGNPADLFDMKGEELWVRSSNCPVSSRTPAR